MSPKTTPDPQELLAANTIWICLVGKSKEIAEAKLKNDDKVLDLLLDVCGVKIDDKNYYKKVIKDCPVTNPW